MAIDLKEVRAERDHMTGTIVGGLRERSRYLLNQGVFTKPLGEGWPTWYAWRLKRDQDTDSASGRYLFEDQNPVLFKREQLEMPIVQRNPPKLGLLKSKLDTYPRVLELYRNTLSEICLPGENEEDYGATVKRDVDNILLLCERTDSIGRKVAVGKIIKDRGILDCTTKEEIESGLRDPKIEQDVLDSALNEAVRRNLRNPHCVIPLFKGLFQITTDIEIVCIQNYQQQKFPIGFGGEHSRETAAPFSTSSLGFGSLPKS